ncbi:protein of unknown function [Sterolibacterium denitrificans]|uniref:Uncharacterized protein n=1 Tax=Sterolibacterium denitrificans TaxID=157592 RepID=A0A7Z7MV25_9PROT|nr:protein of unknown function [Sterolibacterium denitrificans]
MTISRNSLVFYRAMRWLMDH